MLLTALLVAVTAAPAARAQTPGEPRPAGLAERRDQVRISVPNVILAEPASETALPIEIGPVEMVPRNSLLRVRGMPVKAALSEGHAVGPGAWAVPMASVPRLKVLVPVGLAGKSEVTLALVTIDGAVVAEARFALLIGSAGLIAPDVPAEARAREGPAGEPSRPAAKAASIIPAGPPAGEAAVAAAPKAQAVVVPAAPRGEAAPVPVGPPPAAAKPEAPQPPTLSPEARARAQGFLARGEALLRDGDIVSARLFFERASDAGLPEAALALGGTFDPHELGRLKVHGLKPEPATARRWYEKARDLGNAAADERLARLGG